MRRALWRRGHSGELSRCLSGPAFRRRDSQDARQPRQEPELSLLSLCSPPFQPFADVSHPDHTTLLQTAHLLASQSIWPSSISALLGSQSTNAGLFTTWAQSHDATVIAGSISRSLMGGERSRGQHSLLMIRDIKVTGIIHVLLMFHVAGWRFSRCVGERTRYMLGEFSEDLFTPPTTKATILCCS